MTSVRKAKAELERLKDILKPQRQGLFMRIHGETDAEALARCKLDEWPDGVMFWEIWPDELGV